MQKKVFYLILIFSVFSCRMIGESNEKIDKNTEIIKLLDKASQQLQFISKNSNNSMGKLKFPRTIDTLNNLKLVNNKDWTSGFYPGVLWLMYDLTNNSTWKEKAIIYTNLLESEKFNASDHDIGFKMMSSFGLGYKYTKNVSYKAVLIQSAKTLITRFDEKVGCIRSWDHHQDKWEFPVIIDNLMNLELLYWAWKQTGDSVYYNIANTHAKTTIKNHFRSDYSTYHVVNYDTISGAVKVKATHQGFSDDSSWSRGQAWALYAYTMAYRETKDPAFLKQAEHIANYIIKIAKLPNDFIPFWDFSLKGNLEEPKDASAAAIMASALYELSTLTEQNESVYLKTANDIMDSLSSEAYFNKQGTNKGFLLKHSTGSKPKNSEVDVPLIYADYYFLEALSRKTKLTTKINN